MAVRETYLSQINAMSDFLSGAMDEVEPGMLAKRPGDALNPLGFIYFHILRVWDMDLNVLINGRPAADDAWHRGGFTEAMGYSPDGKGGRGSGIGFGYTDQEVDEVPYQLAPLKEYHLQLLSETRAYLSDADDTELNRGITFRDQVMTTGARVEHAISHSWNHIGEIRMTKSMLGFSDPTTPPRG